MIDSLFGLVMLLLMSAWMAELISVQSKLSSSAALLTPREQIDYLAAVSYANPDLKPCRDLLPTAKSPSLKKSLQLLLLSGQLMGRPDGQSIESFLRASQAAGDVPYDDSESDQRLLPITKASNPEPNAFFFHNRDWSIALTSTDPARQNLVEDLHLCPDT